MRSPALQIIGGRGGRADEFAKPGGLDRTLDGRAPIGNTTGRSGLQALQSRLDRGDERRGV
jgi:hypothetical protein